MGRRLPSSRPVGSNLRWYTAATGGTGNSGSAFNGATAGTTDYYVSRTVSSGCETPELELP